MVLTCTELRQINLSPKRKMLENIPLLTSSPQSCPETPLGYTKPIWMKPPFSNTSRIPCPLWTYPTLWNFSTPVYINTYSLSKPNHRKALALTPYLVSFFKLWTMNSPLTLPLSGQEHDLIEKLEVFKIEGRDKRGHKVLRIIGRLFPGKDEERRSSLVLLCILQPKRIAYGVSCDLLWSARLVSTEAFKKYLGEKIFVNLGERPFSVVYVHTGVQRAENFPGISTLRSIYESIPTNIRNNLEAVYFVHPGLQARLFLATFGRLIFSGG